MALCLDQEDLIRQLTCSCYNVIIMLTGFIDQAVKDVLQSYKATVYAFNLALLYFVFFFVVTLIPVMRCVTITPSFVILLASLWSPWH